MPNTATFNSVVFNGAASAAALTSHPLLKYQLRVLSGAGTMLRYLPSFSNSPITERLNAPWSLEFDYPESEPEAASLVFPNQVWVYGDQEQIINKFRIRDVTKVRSGDGLSRHVVCESKMRQLADELVIDYEATAADAKTIRTILKDLLNSNQVGSSRVRIGYIHPSVANLQRNVHFQGQNLFDCIMELRDTVDEDNPRGDIEVSPGGYLNWKPVLGDNKGQQIRLGKNLKGITKKTDPSRLFTRLYAYGEGGGPGNRITLVDAGESNEYIDSNTGTYGIIPKIIVLKNVTDPANLLEEAQSILGRFDTPLLTYDLDVSALEKADPTNREFERLRVGSRVRVIDEDLGITEVVKVVEVKRSLDNPLDLQIQLENKVPQIGDLVSDINKRIETLEAAESGPPPSDDAPVDISQTADAGTSDEWARADHVHVAELSDDTPPPVGSGDSGASDIFARSDHTHTGVAVDMSAFLITAATKAALDTDVDEGQFGLSTSDHQLHCFLNSVWRTITHWRS